MRLENIQECDIYIEICGDSAVIPRCPRCPRDVNEGRDYFGSMIYLEI